MELLQEIGSYAGFAAVLGLAVLSALYFSQARDVRRLRDWAGRAPERDAEARARVAAAGNLPQTPAAQAQAGKAPAAQPAAAQPTAQPATAGNSGNSGGVPAAAPAASASKAPVVGTGPATAGTATAGAATAAAGAGRGGVASPPRPVQRVSAQTAVIRPKDQPREPWYRRIAPRYIALIVAGVLVVGGGIAVGVIQLLGDDGASTTQQNAAGGGGSGDEDQPRSAPLRPPDVAVAVLNATPVPGLAAQFGDKVEAEGFQKDSVGNFNGGQRAESVVLYAPGRKRHAQLVRRRFGVNAIEPVDEALRSSIAPNADVFLVVGADKTQ